MVTQEIVQAHTRNFSKKSEPSEDYSESLYGDVSMYGSEQTKYEFTIGRVRVRGGSWLPIWYKVDQLMTVFFCK